MSDYEGRPRHETDPDFEPDDDYYYEHADEFVDNWDPNDDSDDHVSWDRDDD